MADFDYKLEVRDQKSDERYIYIYVCICICHVFIIGESIRFAMPHQPTTFDWTFGNSRKLKTFQVSNFKCSTSSFQVFKFSSPQVFNTSGVFQTQNKHTSAIQLGHFDFSKPKNTNKHPTNNFVQVVFSVKNSHKTI